MTVQRETFTKEVHLKNCSSIRGTPTSALCMECLSTGCVWSLSADACTWRTVSTQESAPAQDMCTHYTTALNYTKPEILSITPDEVSIHGRNSAVIKGRNLQSVTKVRFQGNLDCTPKESPVLSHSENYTSHESLTFQIPSGTMTGKARVCVLTPDAECHGNAKLTYSSPPTCSGLHPRTTWSSGGREISLMGSKLEFVEAVQHSGSSEELPVDHKSGAFSYSSPAVLDSALPRQVSVLLVVGNTTVTCRDQLTYQPDPQFISFTTTRLGSTIRAVIQKSADALHLNGSEVAVEVVQGERSYKCVVERVERSADVDSIICEVRGLADVAVGVDALRVRVGGFLFIFHTSDSDIIIRIVLILLAIILCGLGIVYCCCLRTRKNTGESVEQGATQAHTETTGL